MSGEEARDSVVEVFGPVKDVKEEARKVMPWNDQADDVSFPEPIAPKKDCQLEIGAAEGATWTVKEEKCPEHAGEQFKALKLTLTITDKEIHTEHEGARPRLTIEHQFNIERYPYLDQKSGEVRWLGRANLYQLEEALGFDPVFVDANNESVEPFLTRNGNKIAPKGVDGVKRKLNAEFTTAYFDTEGNPNLEWAGKTLHADIDIERSEQFGDRNVVKRYKKTPVTV